MSDPDKIPAFNAMVHPAERQMIETMVGEMRRALIPLLDPELEDFALRQSLVISAAALLAGTTVGHMTYVGNMRPNDRKRAEKVVAVNFRSGIKFGLAEAAKAMADAGQMN